jgi:hypothetical protein
MASFVEKATIANQAIIISALGKIEKLSEEQVNTTKNIDLNVSKGIINGLGNIETELIFQSDMLSAMLKKQGIEAPAKREKKSVEEKAVSGMTKDVIKGMSNNTDNTGFKNLAKFLILLGGAFLIFGKGLNMLSGITAQDVMTFSFLMITTFGTLAIVAKSSKDLTLKKVAAISLLAIAMTYTITITASILSEMQPISPKQLITALIIAGTFVPLTAAFIKIIDNLQAFKGGVISDIIEAPIIAVSSMGALMLIPMLAMVTVTTANIMQDMPNGINMNAVLTGVMVGLTLIPMAKAFVIIFNAFKGVGGVQRLIEAIAKKIDNTGDGMSTLKATGSALLMMPLLAMAVSSVAWVFQTLPSKFKSPPLDWTLKTALMLMVYGTAIGRMGKMMDLIMGKKEQILYKSGDKKGQVRGEKTVGRGQWFGLLGSTLILASSIVMLGYIMNMFPKHTTAPPIMWSIGVGTALFIFAKAIGAIIGVIKNGGGNIRKKGSPIKASHANGESIWKSVAEPALDLLALALVTVGVAGIMSFFPDASILGTPPIMWTIGVGLALIVMAKTVGAILNAMRTTGALDPGSLGEGMIFKSMKYGLKDMLMGSIGTFLLAFNMIMVAKILRAFPSENTLKAPPLWWIFKVGIALALFGGVMGLIIAITMRGKKAKLAKQLDGIQSAKMSPKDLVGAAVAIPAVAIMMVMTAYILMALPRSSNLVAPPIGWTLQTGIALLFFSAAMGAFIAIMKGKGKARHNVFGQPKITFKDLRNAAIGVVLVAMTVVAVSYIMQAFPGENTLKAPPIAWTVQIGIALIAFAYAASLLKSVVEGSWSSIVKGGVMLTLLGTSIVAVAWITTLLPNKAQYKSPPFMWIFTTGLAMIAFAAVFAAVHLFKLTIKTGLVATGLVLLMGAAIVGLAWEMAFLPDNMRSIPLKWAFEMSMALTLFGAVFALAGIFEKKIIKGSVAMIVAGAALFVIALSLAKIAKAGDPEQLAYSALVLVGSTFALSMAMALAGKFATKIFEGSLAMIVAGAALYVIALSLVKISKVGDPKNLAISALVLVGATFALSMEMALAGKYFKNIVLGSLAMIVAGAALYVIALSLVKVSDVGDTEKLALSALILVGSTFAVGLIMALAGKYSKDVILGSLSMIVASAALYVIALSLVKVSEAGDADKIAMSALVLVGATLVTAAIMGVAGIFASEIALGSLSMIVAGAALFVIATSLAKAAAAGDPTTLALTAAVLGGSLVVLGLAMAVAGIPIVAGFIFLGSAAMIVASAALFVIALSLAKASETGKPEDIALTGIALSGVLVLLAGSMAGFGFLSPFIIAGAAAMLLASASIITIAIGLAKIAEVQSKYPTFFDPSMQDQNPLKIGMHSVIDAFDMPMKSIAKMYLAVPGVIAASFAIVQIAKGIAEFAKISGTYDLDKVGADIKTVLSVVADSFAEIGIKYGEGMFTTSPVAKGIAAVKGSGRVLNELAWAVKEYANLTFKDENGKRIPIPIEWFDPEKGKIPLMIRTVLTTVSDQFAAVGVTNGETDWFSKGKVEKGIAAIKGAGYELGTLAKAVQAYANLSFTDEKGTKIPLDVKDFDNKTGKIPIMIRTVLSTAAQQFMEVGQMNGETGWFSSGLVEKGINAIKGAGAELGSLADMAVKFANMRYKDKDGKEVNITAADIGSYDKDGKLLVAGRIHDNIRAIILSIASVLGEIGKNPDANTGGWWPGKSNIEKGLSTIKAVGASLGDLTKTIKFAVDIKDADIMKKNVKAIISAIPEAILDLYTRFGSSDKAFSKVDDLINVYPKKLADAIDRIASQQKPMESIARSFSTIAASMDSMQKNVDKLDVVKVQNLGGIFTSLKDIYKFDSDRKDDKGVMDQISNGIKEGIEKAIELIDKFNGKGATSASTETAAVVQAAVQDNVKSKTNTTDKGINEIMVNSFGMMVEQLRAISDKLDHVPVTVTNKDYSIGK